MTYTNSYWRDLYHGKAQPLFQFLPRPKPQPKYVEIHIATESPYEDERVHEVNLDAMIPDVKKEPSDHELRAFLRAFNADSQYFVDYDDVEFAAIMAANSALYKFKYNGEKPSVFQIRATVAALRSASDNYVRRLFKRLLDAEEMTS